MRHLGVLLAPAVVAACLVGCGGGDDYASPRATVNAALEAMKAANLEAIIACYSQPCRDRFAEVESLLRDDPEELAAFRSGLLGVVGALRTKLDQVKVEFGAEKLEGDKATLEVITNGHKQVQQFVKEGGAWKMHSPRLAEMDMQAFKSAIETRKTRSKATK